MPESPRLMAEIPRIIKQIDAFSRKLSQLPDFERGNVQHCVWTVRPIFSLTEGGGGGGGGPVTYKLVPSPTQVTGQIPRNVGAIYVEAGDYVVRGLLGAKLTSGAADTATLKLRKQSDGTVAATLAVTGTIAEDTASVTLTTGWHRFTLEGDTGTAIVHCLGISVEPD